MIRPALDQEWGSAHAPMFRACRLRLLKRFPADRFGLLGNKLWDYLTKRLIDEVFRPFADVSLDEMME